MSESDLQEYKHDDFEVVRTDQRFGGFEELQLKTSSATVSFHCLYFLLLIEGAYSTHTFSANPFHQKASPNSMTCASFCYNTCFASVN
jgi:hypothetical protein